MTRGQHFMTTYLEQSRGERTMECHTQHPWLNILYELGYKTFVVHLIVPTSYPEGWSLCHGSHGKSFFGICCCRTNNGFCMSAVICIDVQVLADVCTSIRAKKNLKGVHSPKDAPTHKISDFSGVSQLMWGITSSYNRHTCHGSMLPSQL